MKTYLTHVKDQIKSFIKEIDSIEKPKSELDKQKEEERLNALKSNLRRMQIGNILIDITTHAASQAVVRRSDLEPSDWETIIRRSINDVKKRGNGYYLYYSKSYEQGIVILWNGLKIYIVTILPKGRSNPKPDTEKVIIEGSQLESGIGITLNAEDIIEIE